MRTSWAASGPPLDRLEAILGHLGTVLDGLGVSWSALGPSWSPLGPLLLKMYVFPSEFDDVCCVCRCLRRKLAIRPGLARNGKSASGTCPRGLTAPFVLEPWRPELFTSSFAFGALGRPRGLTSPFVLEHWRPELCTSSFAFGALGLPRGLTSPFVLEPWRRGPLGSL